MNRTAMVAEMTLRETARRRGVLVLLLVLPLAFYLARRGDHLGQSIRFVCLGLSWALATAALFVGSAARSLEPRLRLSGYRTHQLFLGRLLALWALGVALSAPYFVLILVDQQNVRYAAIAVIMLLGVLVAPLFGLAVSALLPRDLEGMLVLLMVVGLQMILDPAGSASRFLPFWYSREIGTYAIDHTSADYFDRGLLHGAVTAVLLLAVVAVAFGIRLRRRPHVRIVGGLS
ncbi:hypothetical protein [Asanoa siamensis]|uniref:ABC-2 type transport system permease protein n=1 Tax=Asanoa siamensis TaxID=926357 RepID=A0ABQ4CIU9_9ACTN|nr:hypothetical protein [Asanoa siamensis]GIF71186.1 hypothetical protein Asi02nite_07040 [Asanoa siamensis]